MVKKTNKKTRVATQAQKPLVSSTLRDDGLEVMNPKLLPPGVAQLNPCRLKRQIVVVLESNVIMEPLELRTKKISIYKSNSLMMLTRIGTPRRLILLFCLKPQLT